MYTPSPDMQDYPSVAQLLAALDQQLIVPTFGFQESTTNDPGINVYRNLATAFRTIQAAAIPIAAVDSTSNVTTAELIIELINQAYEVHNSVCACMAIPLLLYTYIISFENISLSSRIIELCFAYSAVTRKAKITCAVHFSPY